MKGNIKRVLAATGLVIAVLLIAVSAFPGSTALAQGGNGNGSGNGNNNGNGNGNSQAPYVKCVNGQLVLYEWTMNQNGTSTGSSNNNQGKWMQTVIGTCASNTDAILNQLAKQYGMTRAQLDALVAIEFRNGAIPQGLDLQTWFANYMANQNGTNNSTSSSSNSTNNSSTTSSNSTTSTNQSTSTGTNSGTNSNGGVGGAGAPAVIPTTGGGLGTVSPLVLAFGAILMALGLGVYKASATR